MIKPFALLLLLFWLLCWAFPGWAVEVPTALSRGDSTFTSYALGAACFGMDAQVDGLPCNPAFMAKERPSEFKINFFFGNNISNVQEITKLVDGSGDEGTVEKLFHQTSSDEMEANVEATYLHENWGLSYSPYRLFFYSLIRNSALPEINLYAGEEQSISAQIASYGDKDFYWGLQLKGVERKFIASEFTLTDAIASGGSNYFAVQTQRAAYLEPGFLYSWEEESWKPQVGLTVKNFGFVDHKYDELSTNPDWHFAGSIKPPIELGVLEFGLDFLVNSYVTNLSDVPHLAASYKLGAVQAMASCSDNDYSVGFLLKYQEWNGGLTYWRQKFENLLGEEAEMQTVFLEIGWTL